MTEPAAHLPDDEDATVLPLNHARPSTHDKWRVNRIDTAPMTTQHYDQAVAVLATLITRWTCGSANPNDKPQAA
jgi:hypothetical protein